MNMEAKWFYHILKIKKGEKLRMITVYDKKSKDIQRTLYEEYEHILNEHIDTAVYSYRKGRSNWSAMEAITAEIPNYKFYYKCDIKDFFPSIDRRYLKKLISKLLGRKVASEMMKFVSCCKTGISEGSPLSPILSNFVLSDFDRKIQEFLKDIFYIRFGDDMLILSNGKISYIATYIQEMLRIRGFEINHYKVKKGKITEGFDYLGFYMNNNGTKIQVEKLKNIVNKIEKEQDATKRKLIIDGWKSYYRDILYLPDHPFVIKLLQYEHNSRDLMKLHADKTRTISYEEEQGLLKYALKRLCIPMVFKIILCSRKKVV